MTPAPDLDLDRWLELCERATRGPWAVEVRDDDMGGKNHIVYASGDVCALHQDARPSGAYKTQAHDARFIAASNPAAVKALIERCKRAEAESIERLRDKMIAVTQERHKTHVVQAELAAARQDAIRADNLREGRDEEDGL